ncbi:diguanylate cyclase [Solidesulfovibrio sp.]|uniref:GGDEF domain-containing protein n=1 Tax=Solidesulfovibrio sp. TaxID=2910990 RepID=UPI002B21D18B|nr:diguanylate cyclase [Solidesulfovibrio sp.]MEA5089653.1 diguanylate cyclase [Solidesulfovibrio sp.]HML62364.1 diguanylate cyclase [Solidesulfovibrio sp.]
MPERPLCLFTRPQKIMVLSPGEELAALFAAAFSPAEVEVTALARGRGAVETLFIDPPDMLVVDAALADIPGLELVAMVKSENVYRQLPVAFVMDEAALVEDIDWCAAEVDELLTRPLTASMLRARISLTLARASRSLDANPLTKLPGNTSIIGRIQERIDRKEDFALAYADLDYFKSFNDKYGFSRGDEVLMMTARIIVNTVRAVGGAKAFVGHVGGDDFVFILPVDQVEAACQAVVRSFDDIVPHFYDADDRERGFIQSVDREGNRRSFPLMAISIAVIFNRDGRLTHYGEASQMAMTLKKKAKENPRSCYVLDKRQY